MELASNLGWLVVCVALFGSTMRMLRRGSLKVPRATAFTTTLAVCLLLLPVLSMSDDLLQARQDKLPLAAQTWHLASEGAALGLEAELLFGSCLLAIVWLCLIVTAPVEPEREVRRNAAWLARSLRLRPPPFPAL